MIYTVQMLIASLESRLGSGDLDGCIGDLIDVSQSILHVHSFHCCLQICRLDLFSDVTEEKSVSGITRNVAEAKSNKTFDTLQYVGRFVGASYLHSIIDPINQVCHRSSM
jgi:hypothetical protein